MSYHFWLGADRGAWVKRSDTMPPLHAQVLVRLKEAVGDVFDVACFTGPDSEGVDRWLLANVSLESRQITHWAPISGEVA